jgi:hypothetical protein
MTIEVNTTDTSSEIEVLEVARRQYPNLKYPAPSDRLGGNRGINLTTFDHPALVALAVAGSLALAAWRPEVRNQVEDFVHAIARNH